MFAVVTKDIQCIQFRYFTWYYLTGPLASGLSNRFTERYVIMTSGVILSLSMILTGLSPSVVFVFLSFGLVGGMYIKPAVAS